VLEQRVFLEGVEQGALIYMYFHEMQRGGVKRGARPNDKLGETIVELDSKHHVSTVPNGAGF
jgi:hypothetical protein